MKTKSRELLAVGVFGRVVLIAAVLLGCIFAGARGPRWSAFAQQQRLEFEVASVKPSAPITGGPFLVGGRGGPGTADPGRITYTNYALRNVIMAAYEVKPYQVNGPAWLDTERFDIVAKVPEGATKEQVKLMWQSLLADRFKLTLHHETKDLPMYELTVGKNGPRMKPSVEDPNAAAGGPGVDGRGGPPPPPLPTGRDGIPQLPPGRRGAFIMRGPGRMTITANVQALSALAEMLGNQLGNPVVDKTGLTGTYDYKLEYAPEPGQGLMPGGPLLQPPGGDAGAPGPASQPALNDLPGLLTAIQEQLGLKLEKKRGPVDTLVIDHVEKTPTEN